MKLSEHTCAPFPVEFIHTYMTKSHKLSRVSTTLRVSGLAHSLPRSLLSLPPFCDVLLDGVLASLQRKLLRCDPRRLLPLQHKASSSESIGLWKLISPFYFPPHYTLYLIQGVMGFRLQASLPGQPDESLC